MSKKSSKSLVISFLSLVIFLTTLLSPFAVAEAYDKNSAEKYLLAHLNTGWSTQGLTALGKTNLDIDYLKNISGSKAIDFTKPILAITATGHDPRKFSSLDLVAKLKSFYTANQLGEVETVNDDIFGILALVASGEEVSDPIIENSKKYILDKQNQDGGWGYALSASSDSNTTASAIVALLAVGLSPTDTKIISAINFLKTCQNKDGGFTYDPKSEWGTDSDTSSTAWVMWAINALKQNLTEWTKEGKTPKDYLESYQHTLGYFIYPGLGENSLSADNTAWAIIALEGKTLPLKIITPIKTQYPFRIEGSSETLCEGKTFGTTALDIVKNASSLCSYTYNVKDNNYLTKINSEEAVNSSGWQYWVNFVKLNQSASDYKLKEGDEILWAFGDISALPLKLSANPLEIATSQSSNVLVESVQENLKVEDNAKVLAGSSEFTTNSEGKVSVGMADGYYKIFAQKPGFIRSGKTLLKFGNPTGANIDLNVEIQSGSVAGATTENPSSISFSIEPGSLNFGQLKGGQTAKKQISLKNNGSKPLIFEAEVKTGPLFKDNLAIDGKFWKQFKKTVTGSQTAVIESSLTVPPGTNVGSQTGQLIFWAQQSNIVN